MKIISTLILSLLVISVVASNFVVAQEDKEIVSEKVVKATVPSGSEEVEVYGGEEEEIENIEEVLPKEKAVYWMTQVTIANGVAIKEDESDASWFKGVWIVKNLIILKKNEIKEEEISNIDSYIKKKEKGFIELGFGKTKEKFGLEKVSEVNDTINFKLLDINSQSVNGSKEEVGKMTLTRKKYEHATLVTGNLVITKGEYEGQWGIKAIVKTKIFKPVIRRIPRWKIFAFRKRKEAEIKKRIEEKLMKKTGIKEKLMELKKEKLEKRLNKFSENKKIEEIKEKGMEKEVEEGKKNWEIKSAGKKKIEVKNAWKKKWK